MSDNTATRKNKYPLYAGLTADNKNGVFHAEGNLVRDPYFIAGDGEKKAILYATVGVSRNPWEIFGEQVVKEMADAGNPVNADHPFLTVSIYGKTAEIFKDALKQGDRIAFTGNARKKPRKNQEGNMVDAVEVMANAVYKLPRHGTEGSKNKMPFTGMSRQYTTSDGVTKTQNIATLVAGTVTSVDTVKEVNGRAVLNFTAEIVGSAEAAAAVANRTWSKDASYSANSSIRWGVWGARASSLAKLLKAGMRVLTTGPMSTRTTDDTTYVNGIVQQLSVLQWLNDPAAPNSAPAYNGDAAVPAPAPSVSAAMVPGDPEEPEDFSELMDDDSVELPF